MTEEIRAWIQTIAAIGATLAAIIGVLIAYLELRKKNTASKKRVKEERLTIFSTSDQTTELIATEKGLDLFLSDVRPNEDKGLQWSMSVDELRDIVYNDAITVDPDYDDEHPEWGLVDIGANHVDWLYSKSLLGNPKQVHDKIMGLVKRSIELAKSNP